MSEAAKGVLAMVGACAVWGLSPMYFRALAEIPPLDVLAHRLLWSAAFFGGFLALQRRGREVGAALASRRVLPAVAGAAVLIAVNWLGFIYAIHAGQALEASLGYYIFPLVAVALGFLVLGERFSPLQGVAIGLVALAVVLLTLGLAATPWIALVVASSFGAYGLVKNRLRLGPVLSVFLEMLVLAPAAAIWLWAAGGAGPGPAGVLGDDAATALLLIGLGPLSATPLILFSFAARRVSYATLGLVQYLNPTLQLAVAVAVFGEPFGPWHAVAFPLIWAAIALYSWEILRQERLARSRAISAGTPA